MKMSGPMTSRKARIVNRKPGLLNRGSFLSARRPRAGPPGRSRAPRRSTRAPAGHSGPAPRRPVRRYRGNRCRLSRKAATAISLAALRIAGLAPPAAERRAGKAERREALEVGRLEVERADRDEIEPLARRLHPLGPGERIGDRHAHVGRAELGEHRAVDIFDQASGSPIADGRRPRARRRRPGTGDRPRSARAPCSSGSRESTEILAPIDQLGWATACAGRGARASRSSGQSRNGPPLAVRMIRRTLLGPGAVEALEDRIMLGIDRQQGRAARRAPPAIISVAGRDQRLLVGERDGAARLERRHHRLEARRCRRSPPSSSRRPTPAASTIASVARRGLDAGAGERLARARPRQRCVADHRELGADAPRQLGEAGDVACARSARRPRTRRGSRSIRSSVERPTEPVAPRMVTLRARSRGPEPGHQQQGGDDRHRRAGRRAGRARRHGRAAACRCP